jgi:hypothetical protein
MVIKDPKLKPWERVGLQAVQTDCFPKSQQVVAWIPGVPVEMATIVMKRALVCSRSVIIGWDPRGLACFGQG